MGIREAGDLEGGSGALIIKPFSSIFQSSRRYVAENARNDGHRNVNNYQWYDECVMKAVLIIIDN